MAGVRAATTETLPLVIERLALAVAVIVSLVAVAFTLLAQGFQFENGLVYGGF